MPRSSSSLVLLVVWCRSSSSLLAFPASSSAARRAIRQPSDARRRSRRRRSSRPIPAHRRSPTQETPKPPANPDEALPPVVTSVTPDKATVGLDRSLDRRLGQQLRPALDRPARRRAARDDLRERHRAPRDHPDRRSSRPSACFVSRSAPARPVEARARRSRSRCENPGATLTSLSPLSVVAGAGATTLAGDRHRLRAGREDRLRRDGSHHDVRQRDVARGDDPGEPARRLRAAFR